LIRVKARRGETCEIQFVNDIAMNIDARGLEPPQPLVVILEALAGLPAAR
jgi:hypothetical protein